jgi:hypothetical protein
VIAASKLADGSEVITMWLGVEINEASSRPLIFETVVTDGDLASADQLETYSTIDEAQRGHERLVRALSPKS